MSDFFDRHAELASLERAWQRPGGVLVVVWGRRRTGKTRLLGRFVEGRRSIFYGATQQSSAAELQAFSQAAREALDPQGGDLLRHGNFATWETALDYLAERSTKERLGVVIDEFPYLVDAEPALPSIVQRFWDRSGRSSKLRLVLAGSAVAVMEQMQAERAPLFGRVDARLHVRPFGYREAALFVPHLSPQERAICYAVLGGMPTYLQRWRNDAGHRDNLRELFGDPTSPLVEEGEFVLTSELPEGSGYFRIIRAIASGNRTYGAIRAFADIDIQRQLDRLLGVGLVERETPITENPTKTKRATYRIADNFLTFWFRFVYPRRADIARGLGRTIVDSEMLPGLSDYMGGQWEEMCRDFLRGQAIGQHLPVPVSRLGRWWNSDNSVEIDVVGMDGNRVVLAGSAKWSKRVGAVELARLRRAAEALPDRADDLHLVLFARERVDVEAANISTFTAQDLYE